MPKWDYYHCHQDPTARRYSLDALGDMGWELMGMDKHHFYFKRRRTPLRTMMRILRRRRWDD